MERSQETKSQETKSQTLSSQPAQPGTLPKNNTRHFTPAVSFDVTKVIKDPTNSTKLTNLVSVLMLDSAELARFQQSKQRESDEIILQDVDFFYDGFVAHKTGSTTELHPARVTYALMKKASEKITLRSICFLLHENYYFFWARDESTTRISFTGAAKTVLYITDHGKVYKYIFPNGTPTDKLAYKQISKKNSDSKNSDSGNSDPKNSNPGNSDSKNSGHNSDPNSDPKNSMDSKNPEDSKKNSSDYVPIICVLVTSRNGYQLYMLYPPVNVQSDFPRFMISHNENFSDCNVRVPMWKDVYLVHPEKISSEVQVSDMFLFSMSGHFIICVVRNSKMYVIFMAQSDLPKEVPEIGEWLKSCSTLVEFSKNFFPETHLPDKCKTFSDFNKLVMLAKRHISCNESFTLLFANMCRLQANPQTKSVSLKQTYEVKVGIPLSFSSSTMKKFADILKKTYVTLYFVISIPGANKQRLSHHPDDESKVFYKIHIDKKWGYFDCQTGFILIYLPSGKIYYIPYSKIENAIFREKTIDLEFICSPEGDLSYVITKPKISTVADAGTNEEPETSKNTVDILFSNVISFSTIYDGKEKTMAYMPVTENLTVDHSLAGFIRKKYAEYMYVLDIYLILQQQFMQLSQNKEIETNEQTLLMLFFATYICSRHDFWSEIAEILMKSLCTEELDHVVSRKEDLLNIAKNLGDSIFTEPIKQDDKGPMIEALVKIIAVLEFKGVRLEHFIEPFTGDLPIVLKETFTNFNKIYQAREFFVFCVYILGIECAELKKVIYGEVTVHEMIELFKKYLGIHCLKITAE